MKNHHHWLALTSVLAGAALLPATGFAQVAADYPAKPVRLLLTSAPGGGMDVQGRLFTTKLSERLGRQFIVDNRPAGFIAYQMAAKGAPDGYTLLAVPPSFAFSPALYKNFPVDPIKDFTPISLVSRAPYLLVVNASLPAKSVKELIALAKAQPGKLNFGAGNPGSGTHLINAWFIQAANINAVYIPYKGTGPALLDLVGGQIHAAITNILSSMPHVKTGKLRALGISFAERSKVFPDLPTIAEQGLPGYNTSTYHGWLAPAGTPAAIVNKLSQEIARVANSPEVASSLATDGGEPYGSTPEQFRRLLTTEVPFWHKLIKDLAIEVQE